MEEPTKKQDPQKNQKKPNLDEHKLLLSEFPQPVNLYTYTGGKIVPIKTVNKYDIHGLADERIKKTDVLFAFSQSTFEKIRPGIKIDKKVKAQELRTPQKRKDRPKVASGEELYTGLRKDVRIVMRSGHVLRGKQIGLTRYNIVLKINGKMVLVYRHGLLEYAIQETETTPAGSEDSSDG